MTTMNPEQEAALARVREANKALKAAKIEANEVAKRARREHIARHQAINDKAAAEAHILYSVPYARIAEDGMGTSTHKTAKTAVEDGLAFVEKPAEQVEPEAPTTTPRFQMDGGIILVTLQPEDFEPYKSGFPDGTPTEEQDWAFYIEGGVPKPVDGEENETWMHPVVKVAMSNKMRPEILAFIESQGRG